MSFTLLCFWDTVIIVTHLWIASWKIAVRLFKWLHLFGPEVYIIIHIEWGVWGVSSDYIHQAILMMLGIHQAILLMLGIHQAILLMLGVSGSMHTCNLSRRAFLSLTSDLTLSFISSLWWVWEGGLCRSCVLIKCRLLTLVLHACKLYAQVFCVSGMSVIPIMPLWPWPYLMNVVSMAMSSRYHWTNQDCGA